MQTNQQEEEEEDDCCICNESLSNLTAWNLVRMTCCGKATHKKCHDNLLKSSMSHKQKNRCIMCCTKHVAEGSKEDIDQLRRWVEKGKGWAQSALVACTKEVKVWIKVTIKQKNITKQQQDRDLLLRSSIWVFSITTVKVLSNLLKLRVSGG